LRGAAPPSFSAVGLGGGTDRNPFLDHCDDLGDRRLGDVEIAIAPMIVVDTFGGRRVAILGLARSGRAAAAALAAGGAEVLAWDDSPAVRDAVAGELALDQRT